MGSVGSMDAASDDATDSDDATYAAHVSTYAVPSTNVLPRSTSAHDGHSNECTNERTHDGGSNECTNGGSDECFDECSPSASKFWGSSSTSSFTTSSSYRPAYFAA